MELLQNVIRGKDLYDERYRFIQRADLTVRQIQLHENRK